MNDEAPPQTTIESDAATTLYMRMRPGEPLGSALRRLAGEQLEVARLGFAPSGDPMEIASRIHHSRKAMKRVRALLRLVRPVLGETTFRNENSVLRDQARRLAEGRAACALVDTVEYLARTDHYLPLVATENLGKELGAQRDAVLNEYRADSDGAAAAKMALACSAARFEAWRGLDGPSEPYPELIPGVSFVYEECRKTLKAARKIGGAVQFHEWRKAVNHLRYQAEALSGHLPDSLTGLEASLDSLAEALGVHHDLTELAQVVSSDPGLLAADADRVAFLSAIERRRSGIERAVLKAGKQVYADRTARLVTRLETHWGSANPQ